MGKINLHTHTNYSLDGTFNINDVINNSLKNGISYISITDHNTCDAYNELNINNLAGKGTIIYGMEADALIDNVTYDILCYGFDYKKVNAWAKSQYGTIEERQTKIYKKLENLCEMLNLKLDTSTPFNPKKEYAHSAVFRMLNTTDENKMFLNKYNIESLKDLYRKSTMDIEFPLYIDMSIVWPKIETLAQVIHENGGKIFLAHPYKYAKNIEIDKILNSCKPYVDGIEISNEAKTEEEVKYLYNFAKDNDLLISAGSDYHGSEIHNDFNVMFLTENMKSDIIKWINEVNGKVIIK